MKPWQINLGCHPDRRQASFRLPEWTDLLDVRDGRSSSNITNIRSFDSAVPKTGTATLSMTTIEVSLIHVLCDSRRLNLGPIRPAAAAGRPTAAPMPVP